MILHHLIHVLLLCIAITRGLPPGDPKTHEHNQLLPRVTSRKVLLVYEIDWKNPWIAADGTTFPEHSFLWIGGSDTEGPIRIEIESKERGGVKAYNVRHLDYTVPGNANKLQEPTEKDNRIQIDLGTTDKTNADFFDPNTGDGIEARQLKADDTYRNGLKNKGNFNTCHNLIRRIVENELGLHYNTGAKRLMDNYEAWSISTNTAGDTVAIETIEVTHASPTGNMKDNTAGKILNIKTGQCKKSWKRTEACTGTLTDGDDSKSGGQNELGGSPRAPTMDPADLDIDAGIYDLTDRPVPMGALTTDRGSSVSMARAGGTLTKFVTVGKEALGALGVAGTVVGAVFVILDFVDHNWVGGAIGAVGIAVGVAAGLAVTGPLGWIVGGAVAALFAILPGTFKDAHPPAERIDIQGIIQWKLFGDKSHTGNEQCQQGTKDVPGNKDCQALYGAGTLSMAMGMNNFDAIVFLQQFNDGYAITIKDMAAAFYVVDPEKQDDGSDKIATIVCHNSKGVAAGRAGMLGADSSKVCANPEFKIKRFLIHLPNIGDTADKVFNRIIPAPNGDCKLIAHPGDSNFPDYNVTLRGLPSAIACGLTAAINVNGVAVPVDGDTNGQKPQTSADPKQSTDGHNDGFVAPPPQTPFKPLAQTEYVCIIHGTDQPFCLPPGSYHKQSGLGFEISKVDSLTLPPGGWSLATHWKAAPQAHMRVGRYTDRTYADNQDPTRKSEKLTSFQNDMKEINIDIDGEAIFTVIGPTDGPDPVCCLFTEPKFGGNVWCMGGGGEDTLPQWKDKAQSITCHNGGQVWLYAKEYGDAGAVLIKGNAEDLKDNPYGNQKDTFSKNVKALWVSKG